jgi:spore maturation protein SpmA
MTLSYIWLGFFLVALLIAFVKWAFLNDPMIFKVIVDGIFKSAGDSVDLSFKLIGIMTLFLGFMSIGEKAGAIRFLSRLVGPFFPGYSPKYPNNILPWGL